MPRIPGPGVSFRGYLKRARDIRGLYDSEQHAAWLSECAAGFKLEHHRFTPFNISLINFPDL